MKIIFGNKKNVRTFIICSLIIFFIINIMSSSNLKILIQRDFKTKSEDNNIKLKGSSSDADGKPLLIHQFATITNTFLPLSLPKNVSFTLSENWISKNVTINYNDVSHQKNWIVNGSFDDGESLWGFSSSAPTIIIHQSWQPQYVRMMIDKTSFLPSGSFGYFEENFSIIEPIASNSIATLSIDYLYSYDGGLDLTNMVAFISIDIGGISENLSISLIDLIEGSWTKMSMNYDLNLAGQTIPGNATIRAGVFAINNLITGSKVRYLSIDNIQFKVWTKPNQPDLIIAKDVEFDINYSYENITFGKGKTFVSTERSRAETNDIIFIISKNASHIEDLQINNITITSVAVKIFNSTMNGLEKSIYTINNEIIWQTECSFTIPYGYLDNWAEIKKPSNWNVTSILDGYSLEKKESCTGFDIGSERLIIPQGVLNSGLWNIQAIGQNFITKGNISVWNGSYFNEQFNVTYGDIFHINATLNETIFLTNSQINCRIEYPNGSVFKELQKEPLSYDVDFGEFIVEDNMSVGIYQVSIIWTNNQSFLDRDKVGFSQYAFMVWHHTNLTAVNSYIEHLAGDPLIIKVKFVDYDINSTIEFADVNYSSTYGEVGAMIYIGSAIYFAEIDTFSLEQGDYYFSISASKQFFENLSIYNIIHLKILPEPLAIELSRAVIQVNANNIASCQMSVIGAISKNILSADNISTDWLNPYNITLLPNGTYILELSTENIPTQGYLESYIIEIYANKTFYGEATEILTLLVYPIPTLANTNASLFTVYQDDIIKVKANYTIEDTNELIGEANCTVEWEGSYLITPILNEYEITLNTIGLNIDYYIVLITFRKEGYENAFKSIVIIINEKEVNMSVSVNSIVINENSIMEASFQQEIKISARVSTIINPIYLSGGNITLISSNYQDDLVEGPSTYFNISLILDGLYFDSGINTIFLRYQQTNYTTNIFAFQLYIRAQNVDLTVQIDNQNILENFLIECYYNQIIQLSCRAYAEIDAMYLSGASFKFVNSEQETEIPEVSDFWFNLSIIISSDNFSLGLNSVYTRFEQANYTTTTFTFQLYIRSQNIDLAVRVNGQNILENPLIECYYNQIIQLSCRAYAEIDAMYLSGGTFTFVNNEQEIEIPEVSDLWFNLSITISSDKFSLGFNHVYIRFEQANYTTTAVVFQILVKQIEIIVNSINFEDVLEGIEGNQITIQLKLTEELSSMVIVNATVFYSWNFGIGYFDYISNGTYESKINLPTGYSGNYAFRLIITTNNSIYKTRDYSIIINIIKREIPSYMMWIIMGTLMAAIGILGALSLRSYVILPRKRKKKAELSDKIQVYKDVKNIQALMLIQRNSGLPILTQEIRIFDNDDDSFMVSGFIQAITNFSEVLIQREFTKYQKIKARTEYSKYIIELDFNIFQLLVCDYDVLRILVFLREKSSERLKKQIYFLCVALNSQYSKEFANFMGDLGSIRDDLIYFLNQFLFLHYIEKFKINPDAEYVNVMLNSGELTKMAKRLYNVVLSITKEQKEFNLQDPIEEIHEKNEDLVLEALDLLIKKKIIISTYSERIKGKK